MDRMFKNKYIGKSGNAKKLTNQSLFWKYYIQLKLLTYLHTKL